MRILKTESFNSFYPARSLAEFVNEKGIKQEDIVSITQYRTRFTIFYYSEA